MRGIIILARKMATKRVQAHFDEMQISEEWKDGYIPVHIPASTPTLPLADKADDESESEEAPIFRAA